MRPRVVIVSGVTLDGKISLGENISSKSTMPLPLQVRVYLHSLRAEFDAISVGCNTVKLDNPYLKVAYTEGKNPIRIVPCSKADVSPDANVFEEPDRAILVTTTQASQERLTAFTKKGVRVLIAGDRHIDVEKMLKLLWDMGIESLMIEGGSKLNWAIMSRGLLDELVIIHHPLVVGLKEAPSLADGVESVPIRFKLVNIEVIEGYPITRWVPFYFNSSQMAHQLEYTYAPPEGY